MLACYVLRATCYVRPAHVQSVTCHVRRAVLRAVRRAPCPYEGWFGPEFPEGTDELVFTVGGIIKDVERLKQLYEMFGETLDQLCRIGSAYERAPGVTL